MRLEPEERRNYVHSQLDGYGRLYMSCLELFVQKLWCKQRLLLRTNRMYEQKLSTISEIIGSPKSNEVLNATKSDCEKLENIIQKMHRIIFIPPHEESDLHMVNDLLCREAEDTLWEYEEEEDLPTTPPSSNHHPHLHRQFANCVSSSAVYKDPSTSREPSSRVTNATFKKQQQQAQQIQQRKDGAEAKNNNGHCFSSPLNSSPVRRNTDNTSSGSTVSTIDGRRVSNVSEGESPLPIREIRRSSKRANGGTNGSMQKKSRNNRTKDDKEIVKCCAQKGCEYIERDNANNMRKHYRNWHNSIDYPPAPYVKREMNTEMVNQYLHNWMVQRKKRAPARREPGERPSTDSWPGLSLDGMLVYPEELEEDEDYEINVHLQQNFVKEEKTQENTASSTTQNN